MKHYIKIQSNNEDNPLMLFLHGGPGRSLIGVADQFTDQLQEHFMVVQWDQRGVGETAKLNAENIELTPQLIQDDTYELIRYLLKKYKRKKLYLVSHSWGSIPGFEMAKKHPELLYAYIPISPIVDQEKASKLTMEMLKKWAKKNNNKIALEELEKVKIPNESEEDLFYAQKWLFIHNGVDFATKDDFKDIYFEWLSVWFPVWKMSVQNNLFETTKKINCPIYFFEGNGDKQKSHDIVKRYYKFIQSPKKNFFWFKHSGHTVFNTEPDKLQRILIKKILPKTLN